MSKPRIEAGPGSYVVIWDREQLLAELSRFREHDGHTTAELVLRTTQPGMPEHLHHGTINLTSTQSKATLIKHLSQRWNTINWADVVEQLAVGVLREVRRGEPAEEIATTDEVEPPSFLIDPILPEDEPTILYGPGGVGKSYLSLLIASCIQLPWYDNPLGLKVCQQSRNVLYLDWETEKRIVTWRLRRLQRGMKLPHVSFLYRRCSRPFADDLESIWRILREQEIGCIIIDSVIGAIGGDLKETDGCERLFGAIRQLRVSALLVTHMAKGSEMSKETSPYGTVFFVNRARSVWEVKKVQEAGSEHVDIGLFHKKANETGIFRPLGFRMTFGQDWTRIERKDVREVEELANNLPLKERIVYVLQRSKLTAEDIAESLSTDVQQVRSRLSELRRDGRVIRLDSGHWALPAPDWERSQQRSQLLTAVSPVSADAHNGTNSRSQL